MYKDLYIFEEGLGCLERAPIRELQKGFKRGIPLTLLATTPVYVYKTAQRPKVAWRKPTCVHTAALRLQLCAGAQSKRKKRAVDDVAPCCPILFPSMEVHMVAKVVLILSNVTHRKAVVPLVVDLRPVAVDEAPQPDTVALVDGGVVQEGCSSPIALKPWNRAI